MSPSYWSFSAVAAVVVGVIVFVVVRVFLSLAWPSERANPLIIKSVLKNGRDSWA